MTKPNDCRSKGKSGRGAAPGADSPRESGAPPDDPKAGTPTSRPPQYVFKIVKADPKNTLNFEDVADK